MKSTIFTIQVLGILLFIPAFIILEFNHNKKKPKIKEYRPISSTNKQYQPAASNQLTDKDLLSTGIFFIAY